MTVFSTFVSRRFDVRPLKFALASFATAIVLQGCGGGGEQFASNNTNNTATNNAVTNNVAVVSVEEPPSKPGKYGGALTSATISDPKTFNYWASAEGSSTDATGLMLETLISRNSYTQEWEERLAELPKVSEDGLTWTFTLKPDLKWSDGAPLTADDVIFTLDVVYDEKVQTNIREGLLLDSPDGKGGFKRVPLKYRKIDARTVEFKFPALYAVAREILSFAIAPKHKLEAAWKAGQPNATQFNTAWGINVKPSELVSSGAWLLQSYVPGQRLVYTRNPNYWRKDSQGRPLPYLDKYVSLIVPDLNTMTLKFRSNDTDVLSVQHADYPDIKRNEKKGNYTLYNMGPSSNTNFLSLNLNSRSKPAKDNPHIIKLFRDVRFRRAISHAINRDRIGKTVFLGLASPLYGPETSANKQFYNPNIPTFPYDPAKAKQLLQEIGLTDSNGNKYLEADGKEVKFNILTNAGNNQRIAMATIITDDLRKIGINATFTPINFNSLVARLDTKPQKGQPYPPYDWQAIVLSFGGGLDPHWGRNVWTSSGNLHQWYPYQEKPDTPWEKEIDDIYRKGAQEMDEAKRKALYDRWQVIAAEQLPLIFTITPDVLIALDNKYGNVKPSQASASVLWNLDEIYSMSAARDTP